MAWVQEFLRSDDAFFILGVAAAFIFVVFITLWIHRSSRNGKKKETAAAPYSFAVGENEKGSYFVDENTLQALSDIEPVYACYLKHVWSEKYREARLKALGDTGLLPGYTEAVQGVIKETKYSVTELNVNAKDDKGRIISVKYYGDDGNELNTTNNDKIAWVSMQSDPVNFAILKRVKSTFNEDIRQARVEGSVISSASSMRADIDDAGPAS